MTGIRDLVDLKDALAEDGWIASFAKVSRPLAVTLTVAIPALGAASVGLATIFDPAMGAAMAKNSAGFLSDLPEALYWMVGGIATGYFGAKAFETRSPPPPAGRASPEATPAADAAAAIVTVDAAAVDRAKPDPSMVDSGIDAGGHAAVQDPAIFDEDAPPPLALFDPRRTDPLPVPLFGQEAPQDGQDGRFATKELSL